MREVSLIHNDFAELSAKILSRGGSFCFKAHGFSMYPFIHNGDIISVHPADFFALNSGDIVLYHVNRKHLVAHRIVAKKVQNGKIVFKMRGDAMSYSNEWIQAEQVMGKVVSIQRGEKLINLNRNFQRLISLFWIKLSPISCFFFRIACTVKKAAQRFQP